MPSIENQIKLSYQSIGKHAGLEKKSGNTKISRQVKPCCNKLFCMESHKKLKYPQI